MILRKRFLTLLTMAVTFPGTLMATTLVELSPAEMTAEAAAIVHGTCTDVRSTWIGRNLVTLATISITETLKGGTGSELTLVLPGGVDMSRPVPIAVTWPGAPVVRPDDELVLFLEQGTAVKDAYSIVGYSQGKYAVVRDPLGRTLATRAFGMQADPPELAEFKQRIRELVSGQSSQGRIVQ